MYCSVLFCTVLYCSGPGMVLFWSWNGPGMLLESSSIRDYSGLFGTIRDYSGLFGTIRDYSGLFGTIQDYSGLFGTIQDYSGLFGTIRDYSNSGRLGAQHLNTKSTVRFMVQIWKLLGRFRQFWRQLGATWGNSGGYLGRFQQFWRQLGATWGTTFEH